MHVTKSIFANSEPELLEYEKADKNKQQQFIP